VEKDFQKAACWLEKAARQEHPQAQYMLACLYDGMDGVPRDRTQSEYWLKKAAENGHEQACQFWTSSPDLVARFEKINGIFDKIELPQWKAAGMGDKEIAGQRFLYLQEWI